MYKNLVSLLALRLSWLVVGKLLEYTLTKNMILEIFWKKDV